MIPSITLLMMAAFSGSLRANSEPLRPDLQQPKELKEVGVEERRDTQLPLDTHFRNEEGHVVRLRDYFTGDRPVILSLNYSNCPMLCSAQLNGLANSLHELEWSAGREFEIVSVSIDPHEKPARAKETRDRYLDVYDRGRDGWNFLVGPQRSIDAVTKAVGFNYTFLPDRQEYAHTAVIILCTPEGRISRYLYGVAYPEQTLRLSLAEASEGKIGGAGEQILLYCFHYDPKTGTYAPRAARLAMSVAGCATVLVIVTGVFVLRSREYPADVTAESTEPTESNA